MMAEACRFNGGTCRLVVALDDKSWGCFLNIVLRDLDKCSAMRRLEVAASAANLNASHEFYGYPEGIHNWNDAGVQRNLQAREAAAFRGGFLSDVNADSWVSSGTVRWDFPSSSS